MGKLGSLGECDLAFGDNPDGLCAWCGDPLTGRRRRWCSDDCGMAWGRQHIWNWVRAAVVKRDGGCVVCGAARYEDHLEVNHIEPRRGAGYENGCHHHQDGLETLCHQHHLVITSLQRRPGFTPRPAPELLKTAGDQLALEVVA